MRLLLRIHGPSTIVIEDIKPVPDGTYSPKIEGADEAFTEIVLCKCEEDLW